MKEITISNLFKSFDRKTYAVNGISFVAEFGKMTTLLGPSGCGKTTTLRCVAGLEKAERGSILVGDQPLFDADRGIDVPTEERKIGMVFQNYALWPHLTVFKNIAFGLSLRGWRKNRIRVRVAEVLEIIQLKGRDDAMPGELSGGQQQRVALARALAFDPEVLLLDEPLANLDARLREEMRYELRKIQERMGITALYVTHDQIEAMVLSDKIIVISEGRIEQEGTPREIYDYPSTAFVATFIGLSNFLPVKALRMEGGRAIGHTPLGEIHFTPRSGKFGDDIKLMIRPEDIQLRNPPSDQDINVFDLTVDQTVYQGENRALFLSGPESVSMRVHISRHTRVEEGQTVYVYLSPEHLVQIEG